MEPDASSPSPRASNRKARNPPRARRTAQAPPTNATTVTTVPRTISVATIFTWNTLDIVNRLGKNLDEATIRDTIDFAKSLPLDIALFHVAAPYPGTPFFFEVIENGWFKLNGKRLFLKSTHTGNHFPIGQIVPPTPDLLRRFGPAVTNLRNKAKKFCVFNRSA